MLRFLMALDRQKTIPSAITAGTTLRLDLDIDNLLASDGGSIAISFRGPGDIEDSDFTYGVDGDTFTVDVASTITTNWPAGIYQYTIKHTDASDVVDLVGSARLEILADPANESKKEARTFTEIFLSRVQALAKELALNPYKTIQFGDTIYSAQNITDLHNLIIEYEARLVREQQADIVAQGGNAQYDIAFELDEL